MRIGIISDIHGNLPALDEVLADLATRRVEAIYCLGDLVGYGPFPNEVIAFGHTHRPYSKVVEGVRFVNAGSVGRPKDGDWRACYVILNTSAADPVEFIRVPYDAAHVAAVIRASELPDAFADLIEGRIA